ncbi:MAG: hypothetical protein WCY21_01615 [Candidatus Cloacimonadaceae bacterium]
MQDKIQKLISQYTEDKKQLVKLEKQNETLREENSQLMVQVENIRQSSSGNADKIRELEQELSELNIKYQALQDTVSGFEDIASEAIEQIDSLLPDLDQMEI